MINTIAILKPCLNQFLIFRLGISIYIYIYRYQRTWTQRIPDILTNHLSRPSCCVPAPSGSNAHHPQWSGWSRSVRSSRGAGARVHQPPLVERPEGTQTLHGESPNSMDLWRLVFRGWKSRNLAHNGCAVSSREWGNDHEWSIVIMNDNPSNPHSHPFPAKHQ